jgi:acetyl coenzyme A synthetase (ADP forming)-like protein
VGSPGTPLSTPPGGGTDVLLSDGTTAHVRPITPGDAGALVEFHARLSPETVVLRFFGPHPRLSEAEVARFTTVDGVDRMALVAERAGRIVAVARYDRAPGSDEAEVAFVVEDDFQGRGIATILLEHLASAARALGVRRFVADTLSENFRMLHVFRDAGFARQFTRTSEVMRVVLDIAPSPEARTVVDERDRRAAVRSMERLLRPTSIAVVGASRREGTTGHQLVANLLAAQFHGPVYPVNPAGGDVAGVPAWLSVTDIPGPVDLALVAVPAPAVAAVVEACGRKGVGALVVVSTGFAESGDEGAARQRQVVALAHTYGMRMVGPNCLGVVNTEPGVSMNASLAPAPPVAGPIGFASQSGGLGMAILAEAGGRGLGLSSFVSLGNKADISGNDALVWWEHDPRTEVVLLYLESFGNPRRFARVARRLGRSKPVVAVKSGRSAAGRRGAASHTAALARPEQAVEALFRHTGAIRADTIEELFDVAAVLALQPLPRGRRVGIVGNAGGPGVLAADACAGHGLTVPELSDRAQEALRASLPVGAAVSNPVDLMRSATADDYRRAVGVLAGGGEIDALLVVFTPPPLSGAHDVAAAVLDAAHLSATTACGDPARPVPVVASVLGTAALHEFLRGARPPVPCFAYPETAARALGRVTDYAQWRTLPEEAEPVLAGLDPNAARRRIEAVTGDAGAGAGAWITGEAAAAVLRSYGIPCAAAGAPETEESEQSVATVAGFVQDPAFGPLVLFGMGGPETEPADDRAARLAPLTDGEARQLVGSVRGAGRLTGRGGTAPADLDALVDVVLRLGRLAEDLPELAQVECDPVLVGPAGAAVVQARIRLGAPAPVDDRRHLA